jgi:hypothetical protein
VEEPSQVLANDTLSGTRSPLRFVNGSAQIKSEDTPGKVVNPTPKPESLCPLFAPGTTATPLNSSNDGTNFRDVSHAQSPPPQAKDILMKKQNESVIRKSEKGETGLEKQEEKSASPGLHASATFETLAASPVASTTTIRASPTPSSNTLRIQGLLANGTPEMLEVEVKNSIQLLDRLKNHILPFGAQSTEAHQWIRQISKL